MISWWQWAVLAAVLGYAELHAPGSYLIWIAAGAAITAAIRTGWSLSLEAQLAIFGAASVISCGCGYYVYRLIRREPAIDSPLNRKDRSMIGARGVVSSSIVNGQGKVRVGDSVWLAEGLDMQQGTPVIVTAVRGSRLIVTAE